jgi:3-isopropylmalate/(R)-2-methylmalate dehydratase small subunit
MELKGRAHKFGDDINTDYILSSRHRTQTLDYAQLAEHLMGDIRPGFYQGVERGDFIVAGANFGCGSSREYAPKVVKAGGIGAILAKSFARIFYRNAINVGLPLIECNTDEIHDGDVLRVRLDLQVVLIESRSLTIQITPLPALMISLLKEGGVMPFLRRHKAFPAIREGTQT